MPLPEKLLCLDTTGTELMLALAEENGELARREFVVNQPAFDGVGEAVVVHRGGEAAFAEEFVGLVPEFGDGIGLGVDAADVRVPVGPELQRYLIGDA